MFFRRNLTKQPLADDHARNGFVVRKKPRLDKKLKRLLTDFLQGRRRNRGKRRLHSGFTLVKRIKVDERKRPCVPSEKTLPYDFNGEFPHQRVCTANRDPEPHLAFVERCGGKARQFSVGKGFQTVDEFRTDTLRRILSTGLEDILGNCPTGDFMPIPAIEVLQGYDTRRLRLQSAGGERKPVSVGRTRCSASYPWEATKRRACLLHPCSQRRPTKAFEENMSAERHARHICVP